MSLAIFAAPFDNHTETYTNTNTNDSSSSSIIHKKRMQQQPSSSSSHNKTQKKRENFDTNKVNSILEKIHNQTDSDDENENNEYSSSLFQPPPNPESIGASKTKSTSSIFPNQGPQPANRNEHLDLNDIHNYGTPARAEEYYKKNIPNYEAQKQRVQPPHYPNYSNYYKPATTTETPDVLMQKINYMISLLEEQKDDKTNNVTEEFIMYSFLGIFIIYIVDAFARSGKYTR